RALDRHSEGGLFRSWPRVLAMRELCQLQMAPARRDKDRGVRVEGIPVGHSRNVIRDGALDAVALCDPLVLGRQQLGTLLEMLEKFPEHPLRFAVLGLGGTCQIHV